MTLSAKQAFKQRVRHWARQLDVPIAWLAVRPMRQKWASCSTSGHLHFSVDLLSLDPTLWDYVIVHELLHACLGPSISEEAVTEAARVIRRTLVTLNYREVKDGER